MIFPLANNWTRLPHLPTDLKHSFAGAILETCRYCGTDNMSTIPPGLMMVQKIRQNEKKTQENFSDSLRSMNSAPLKYNSKMMNSIWGQYNRYSVHNFKKNIDKDLLQSGLHSQVQSGGQSSPQSARKNSQLLINPWDKVCTAFGNAM